MISANKWWLRITTLGHAEESSCIDCIDLVERDEVLKKGEKVIIDHSFQSENTIPGLDPRATVKSTDDANLPPLSPKDQTSLQYGDTSITSLSTDHPDWAAGRCLIKHTSVYRVKTSGSMQQVLVM